MQPSWTKCYRLQTYLRNTYLVCTIVLGIIGIGSTLAAYFNIDGSFPHPKIAALTLGLFGAAFTSLGIWLLFHHHKYRLFINETSLRQVGVVRDQQAEFHLVDELKWRCYPQGGSVRILGNFGILKIELGHFSYVERKQIITFLRQTIKETKQLDWEKFQKQFADTPQKRQRSRRSQMWLGLFFAAHAIGFGIMWFVTGEMQRLVAAVVNVLATIYSVVDRGPRVYPGVNETGGGILAGWI